MVSIAEGRFDLSPQALSDPFDEPVTDLDGGQRHPKLCSLAHRISEHRIILQPAATFEILQDRDFMRCGSLGLHLCPDLLGSPVPPRQTAPH